MSSSIEYQVAIPGPIDLAQNVLDKLSEPMMPHFGQEWADEYSETVQLAKEVFQTQGEVYIIPGSGSAALDMGIGNLIYNDKSVLVLYNGFFGARLEEMAKGFSPNVDAIDFGFAEPFDINRVESALKNKAYDVLMMVHVETSIGIVNPVEELASITRESDTVLFVDCVSSIGVEAMYMDSWGVDICASASQKGLEAPPGLGLLAFNEKAWKMMETVERPDWYLNLKVWKRYEEYWGPSHPQLVTHAVPIVRSMTVALKNILKNGYGAHIDDCIAATEYFRAQIEILGYELFINENYSHGLTAIKVPEGKAQKLMDYFKNTHHVLIGGGLGPSKGKVIRIGHMGIGMEKSNLKKLITILELARAELSL